MAAEHGGRIIDTAGRPVDVRRVGRELGVGYLLEGSIRRASDRVDVLSWLLSTCVWAAWRKLALRQQKSFESSPPTRSIVQGGVSGASVLPNTLRSTGRTYAKLDAPNDEQRRCLRRDLGSLQRLAKR